jgi:HSP20 family protein
MDRLMGQVLGSQRAAASMPMDLYRAGDHYVLHVDLPGADPGSIDVNVDARQLTVGRGLDLDAIHASYADGVLTLTIPVAEEAKPRRIEVQTGGTPATIEAGADATQERANA